jgi:5-methylthioadenosine/S-adenosylhomocysteine deaminase
VIVEDDRIEMVGEYDALRAEARGAEVIDTENCIIIPGLIDTHVHLAQALIRGVVPDNVTLVHVATGLGLEIPALI